jgi:phosphoribosylanthranilate isomerase
VPGQSIFAESHERGGALKIKICGITNAADGKAAIECGADALGFNCFPGSKRYIDMKIAGEWISQLPETTAKIAILVNPSLEEALATAALPFVTALQLHGAETPEFCGTLAQRGVRFAKALPVTSENSVRDLPSFATDTLVLDASHAGEFGGTGRVIDWEIARRFIESNPRLRVILAGGLTPENVAAAVRKTGPFAVDVTTGVESAPGHKDPELVRAFIEAARGA